MIRPLTRRQLEVVRRLGTGQVLRRPEGWRAFLFFRSGHLVERDHAPVNCDQVMRLLAHGLVVLHDSRTGDRIFGVPPHLNGRHLEVRIRTPEGAA